MDYLKYIVIFIVLCGAYPLKAEHNPIEKTELDMKELILEHIGDAYEWHITTIGENHISIPLLVIVKGENSGWQVFLSSEFHHGHSEYNGFYISNSEEYKGKIVEKSSTGEEIRPWDFSITKNVASLLMGSILLVSIILSIANWYKRRAKRGEHEAPKGFVGFMEMFIMNVYDDIIRPCVGKDHAKFAPYLLTAFFFIFINNIMGLIPIFPGGANLTGNIAVTFVLALFTFFIVNISGTKEYWREIFWPDVPLWLKIPPIMPIIEIVSVLTKPFALMIRLFANILAGHSIVLGLTCLIFVTVSLGAVINTSMTIVSVVLTIFINLVEILVAYIQAYVFTMLSAVFIGLARVEPHHHPKKQEVEI